MSKKEQRKKHAQINLDDVTPRERYFVNKHEQQKGQVGIPLQLSSIQKHFATKALKNASQLGRPGLSYSVRQAGKDDCNEDEDEDKDEDVDEDEDDPESELKVSGLIARLNKKTNQAPPLLSKEKQYLEDTESDGNDDEDTKAALNKPLSNIFQGCYFVPNGYLNPTEGVLRRLIHRHGGELNVGTMLMVPRERVTHYLCETMSEANAKNIRKGRSKGECDVHFSLFWHKVPQPNPFFFFLSP